MLNGTEERHMTTDDPVRRALAAVADADASRHAPPHLERAVLDALDQQMNPRFFQRCVATAWAYRHAVAAMALAVIVTATMYFGGLGDVFDRRSLTTQREPLRPTIEHPSVQTEAQPIQTTQGSGDVAQRVLVRLPRAMLPMLGVPIINPDAPGTVNLEVILREDGLAKTIRIVP
jgi:hypothetical protein